MTTKLRPGDQVAVFTTCGGRFRRGLKGRVVGVSTRMGRGERLIVLLDLPTRDGFGVLEVLPTEVVRITRKRAESSRFYASSQDGSNRRTEIRKTVIGGRIGSSNARSALGR